MNWLVVGLSLGALFHSGHMTVSRFFGLSTIFVVGFVFFLYKFQESLLYQPKIFPQFATPEQNPAGYRNPSEQGMSYEDVWLTTPDGLKLHAWYIRPDNVEQRKERNNLLFFHANAGNMGFRMENLKMMYEVFNLNIFILSYRGYGNSEGAPTEHGLKIDAETLWQYVMSRDDIDRRRVFLFGRSLGGAVAFSLAARHEEEIAGTIVENTFTSISSMVDVLFPILAPLKPWVLRMDWNTLSLLPKINHPLFFISGEKDEVVPAPQMKALYDAAVSQDKEILLVKNGTHNNTWAEGKEEYIERFKQFLQKFGQKVQSKPMPPLAKQSTSPSSSSSSTSSDSTKTHIHSSL